MQTILQFKSLGSSYAYSLTLQIRNENYATIIAVSVTASII